MKKQEEIEKLTNELIGVTFCGHINITDELKEFYIKGYSQCQRDMADKRYTEEDLMNAFNAGINNVITHTSFDQWLNSLNKQD